jgi:hypothetical protein
MGRSALRRRLRNALRLEMAMDLGYPNRSSSVVGSVSWATGRDVSPNRISTCASSGRCERLGEVSGRAANASTAVLLPAFGSIGVRAMQVLALPRA